MYSHTDVFPCILILMYAYADAYLSGCMPMHTYMGVYFHVCIPMHTYMGVYMCMPRLLFGFRTFLMIQGLYYNGILV